MDCGLTFAKYFVFIFNFLFACLGIAMIAGGAIAHNKVLSYEDFLDGNLSSPTILMIVIGVVVFLIAFLGCCGAIKESTCMLYLFGVIMLLIIGAQIAVIWTSYSHKNHIEDTVEKKLRDTLQQTLENRKFEKTWDLLQKQFKCCGVDSIDDWIKNNNNTVPAACCNLPMGQQCEKANAKFNQGCLPTFKEFIADNATLVAGIAIGVALYEVLGFVFACCLYSSYRRNHY